MTTHSVSSGKAETVGASAPPESAAAQPSWATLPVVLVPVFMISLDVFIVNVAIPSIQADLHATPAAVQFVISGFALAIAAALITAGRMGDLYGRRRMFVLGLALFTLASAACGLAPNAADLVAARVVQGLGAAIMSPQAIAILGIVYTGASRIRAFRAYGLAIGFAGVFGQLIGGALIRTDVAGLGWRIIFLINVPVGLVALVAMLRVVPESRGSRKARLDLVGAVLVSLGLVAVVLPLIEGREQGWPLWTWLCLLASVVLLAGFVAYEGRLTRRDAGPVLNLELFRQRAFSVGLVTTFVYYSAMASFFLVLALYLQQGQKLDALASGVVFLPLGIGFFAASLQASRLASRLGRQTLAVGGVAVAVGYGLLALTVDRIGVTGVLAWAIPALFVAGFGMGMVMAPLTSLVLAGVSPQHAASASGVLSTALQVGNAFGVAVIGLVFYNVLGADLRPSSVAHALVVSLIPLVVIAVAVAVLVQFLTTRPAKAPAA